MINLSNVRYDDKKRRLNEGESQRKDGRYAFKYKDAQGKIRFEYSWKLNPGDTCPKGKKADLSLREKEAKIQKDLMNGICPAGGKMTVLELVERYLATKIGVKPTTEANYKTVVNILKKQAFGSYAIENVKKTNAKVFLVKLQKEDGLGSSSIHNIRGVLKPAFRDAVDDDLIRHNPFDFMLADVIVNDSVTREAITRDQQRKFLEFIKADAHFSKYYDGIYILFNTGLRISEFVGLTTADLNMEAKTFKVDHQMLRKSDGTKYIQTPKTKSGKRVLPMEGGVYECFKRILDNRNPPIVEPTVDGYSGFLFFDKDLQPMVAMHWEKYFQHIVAKYNKIYKEELPAITPHVCRHTYCSNKAKSGMNPKTLQYLMGHSDVSITMNTYTHLGLQDAWEELKDLELKMAKKETELQLVKPA